MSTYLIPTLHYITTVTTSKKCTFRKNPPYVCYIPIHEVHLKLHGIFNKLPILIGTISGIPAKLASSYADVLYNQIYISPILIEVKGIKETVIRTFIIWNAYFRQEKTCVNFKQVNLPDVQLATNPLITFPPLYHKKFTLVFHKKGVLTFNGHFEFTFDQGEKLLLQVRGSRIPPVIPNFYCYFPEEVVYTFSFSTALATNMLQTEQRRPIHHKMIKTLNLKFTIPSNTLQGLLQYFDYATGQITVAPILYEPLTFREFENLQGKTLIYVNEDISQYEELRYNAKFLVIYSPTKAEVVEIDSINITDRMIRLRAAVLNSFLRHETIIFPAFMGILNNVETTVIRGDTFDCNIEIKEYLQ